VDRDNDRSSRSQGGGWAGGSSWDRGSSGGISDRDRERSYGRIGRGGSDYMNQDRGQQGRSSWDRDQNRNQDRAYGPSRGGGYWSESGNRDRSSSSNQGFGGFRDESDFRGQHRRDHPQSWGEANRGENESLGYSEYSGTLGGFGNQTFGSSQDDHYRSWRDRQMSQLDKDYGDYCREREQQFHSDFDSWRRKRPSQSPLNLGPSDELGVSSNAGVGTTTASMTGTGGQGSASAGATGTGGSVQADTTGSTETSDTGGGSGRGSRSRT